MDKKFKRIKAPCSFCLRKGQPALIASPLHNKRRVYICFQCVEVCMKGVLEERYSWKEKADE
jgi:hypothetical protein